MEDFTIEELEIDTRIEGVGGLFRRDGSSEWEIDLLFAPKQEKDSLSLSKAPIVARNRWFNQTKEYYSTEPVFEIKMRNVTDWISTSVWACAEMKRKKIDNIYSNQRSFYFKDRSGVAFILPHFELARALFLRDAYLARTSMNPECLKNDFDISRNPLDGSVRINVLPTSGCPIDSCRDVARRQVLTWILLDFNARKSYESIGLHQIEYGKNLKQHRWFDYSFSPPPLEDVTLRVTGEYYEDTRCMFIGEVKSIEGVVRKIAHNIELYHPKLNDDSNGNGVDGKRGRYIKGEERAAISSAPGADRQSRGVHTRITPIVFADDVKIRVVQRPCRRLARSGFEFYEAIRDRLIDPKP